jgi:hypothetical protein
MNNTIETTTKLYTGNIGWNGTKRHIISVEENADGSYCGRNRSICSDAFCWDGTQQPTQIKKVAPTIDNVSCKKCLIIVERIEARKTA